MLIYIYKQQTTREHIMTKTMKLIIARLNLNIAIEEYNKLDDSDWVALKNAQDKINIANRELQCVKAGLR